MGQRTKNALHDRIREWVARRKEGGIKPLNVFGIVEPKASDFEDSQ